MSEGIQRTHKSPCQGGDALRELRALGLGGGKPGLGLPEGQLVPCRRVLRCGGRLCGAFKVQRPEKFPSLSEHLVKVKPDKSHR